MKKTITILMSILLTGALLVSGAGISFASQDAGEAEGEVEEILEREMMDIDDRNISLEEEESDDIENQDDLDNPDSEFEDTEEEQEYPDEKYHDDRG
jgi:hypothetical protein